MQTYSYYNLDELFLKIVKDYPKHVAINPIDGQPTTYEELDALSQSIASYMHDVGVKKDDVIVVLHNKTSVAYSIMLACLKIGAIYTNLDPKSPPERFNRMLDICKPKRIFYYEDTFSLLEKVDLHDYGLTNYTSVHFKDNLTKNHSQFLNCISEVSSNTPAYIMFTSGSTGFPKGVVISQQNVLNFIKWSQLTYDTTSDDIFTNINPMHFDNSVFDFYASLFTGASLIPINEQLTRNPRKLIDALNKVQPTIWFSVPSMLVYVLNMRALRHSDLKNLRIVTFGGEGFPKNQLRKLWSYWGNRVRFVNVYGPTECTCICSSYNVTEDDLQIDDLLPLGPMALDFYGLVVDSLGNEVNLGEIGELYIGGSNVGMGYYNNDRKTQEVFIEYNNGASKDRIVYKSGDLVKQDLESKFYLFCGRKDNQIKRMGYRIELEEIENALNSVGFIKECAVVYVDNEKYTSKIIGCIHSEENDKDEITQILKKYLPSYMLPDLYYYFDILPKNQNGKIDRLQLKELFNA